MKATEIQIGRTYAVKVSGKIVPGKVLSTEDPDLSISRRVRWLCENTLTGRKIVVKSPQRFRREIRTEAEIGEAPTTVFGRQWAEMKGKDPDMILLFRIGDFYEAFGSDAQALHGICLTVLIYRNAWPMTGFPHHDLEIHLRKLLAAGRRAAICEQINESPSGKLPIVQSILPNPS